MHKTIWGSMASKWEEQKDIRLDSELNLYLEIPQISIKENMDALEWWKTRERTFPKL